MKEHEEVKCVGRRRLRIDKQEDKLLIVIRIGNNELAHLLIEKAEGEKLLDAIGDVLLDIS